MEVILLIILFFIILGVICFIVENFDTILIVVGVVIAVAVVAFIIFVIKDVHKAKQNEKIEEHKAKQNKKIEEHKAEQNKKIEKQKETEDKKIEIKETKEKIKEKLIVAKFFAPPKAYKVPCLSNNIKGEQKRVNEAYVKFLNRKNEIDKAAAKAKFYLDLNRSYEYLIEENVEVADYLSYKKEREDAFEKYEALLKDIAPLNKLPIQSSAYNSLAQSFYALNIVDDKNDVPTELIEFFSNFSNDVYFKKVENNVYIFNPLYIWKYDCDKMTFTIIDYSDFYASVDEETKTIDEDTYIKDGYSYDDIKEMHYTYENIDGIPDRRRNYNPAYYDVYDCYVLIGQQGYKPERFYDFIKVGSKDKTEDTVKEINKFFAKKDNIGTIQLKNAILTCKDGNFEEKLNELKKERKNELDKKKHIEQEKKAEEERIEKEKQEEKKRIEEEKKAEKQRIEEEQERQRKIAEEKENERKENDRQQWLLNEWNEIIKTEKKRKQDEIEEKEREQKENQRIKEEIETQIEFINNLRNGDDSDYQCFEVNDETLSKIEFVRFNCYQDYAYTSVLSFSYNGTVYPVDGKWSSLYISLLKLLYQDYERVIKDQIGKSIDNRKRVDIVKEENLNQLKKGYNFADDLYVEINMNASDIVSKISYLMKLCNVKYNQINILFVNRFENKTFFTKKRKKTANSERNPKKKSESNPFNGLSNDEVQLILEHRKQAEEEARKVEEGTKKRQAQLELEQSLDIGALVQANGQKVITNNIFSLELTQKEDTPNTEKYKLYFIDELGNIISNEKTIGKMAIGESTKVTFELFSKLTFSASKPYYLLVSDDSDGKLISKTQYKIDIAFSNDFGF